MKKIIAALFTLLMSGSLMAAIPNPIRFATEATYPPFEYTDESGKIKGFDIDIAQALCQQMKVECTFSNQSFNSLVPSLKIGKFDAVIASLGVTSERLKQVDFTNAYYEPSAVFVAALNKHYTLNDIDGKSVGAQEGSTFLKYLQDKYGNKITVKSYASVQDAFLDLVAGRVDLVLADTPIATTWIKQPANIKQFAIIGKPIADHEYFGVGYGIAVRKNNPELLNAFNKALADIKANGIYQKIRKQYGY